MYREQNANFSSISFSWAYKSFLYIFSNTHFKFTEAPSDTFLLITNIHAVHILKDLHLRTPRKSHDLLQDVSSMVMLLSPISYTLPLHHVKVFTF